METFKFQLYSDIHLEYQNSYPLIKPIEENLILAGDIGILSKPNYKPFFDYCSNNWKKVFYVLGNHEYYYSTDEISVTRQKYIEFFKNYDNIIFLDNSVYEYSDNLRIVGSVLWSEPKFDDRTFIDNFEHRIKKNLGITLQKFNELHKNCVDFMLNEINKKDKHLLIITHFPPSQRGTLHPKYDFFEQFYKDYSAAEVVNYISENKILSWIFGHTHYSTIQKTSNDITLISNQVGYSEESDINIDWDGVFEIVVPN
jgi:predicted phosphohydrolase